MSQPSTPFDPDRALEIARMVDQARVDLGYVASADEEAEASEDFMRWAQASNLRAQMRRVVREDGRVAWVLHVDAGRGTIETAVSDPRDWMTAMTRVGLMDAP